MGMSIGTPEDTNPSPEDVVPETAAALALKIQLLKEQLLRDLLTFLERQHILSYP
jgi:hypothetical protein